MREAVRGNALPKGGDRAPGRLHGLGLADTGFDFSVLCEFRTRVAEHGIEAKALDLLVTALVDKGLIKARGKARTDSTHVLAAVRDLNRLELAGEAVRAALEALAATAPHWLGRGPGRAGMAGGTGARRAGKVNRHPRALGQTG